jgi:hypothetical protein
MKIYRVIDNGDVVLTTDSELKALRKLREVMVKHDVTWGWVDEEVLQ